MATVPVFLCHSWMQCERYDWFERLILGCATVNGQSVRLTSIIEEGVPLPYTAEDMFSRNLKFLLEKQVSEAKMAIVPIGLWQARRYWVQIALAAAQEAGVPVYGLLGGPGRGANVLPYEASVFFGEVSIATPSVVSSLLLRHASTQSAG